jgi:hypothetical protein
MSNILLMAKYMNAKKNKIHRVTSTVHSELLQLYYNNLSAAKTVWCQMMDMGNNVKGESV